MWASSPSVIAYETGKLSAQAFAEDVESDLGLAVSPEDFITNFSGWANSLYPGTMELFEALPNSLLVAALSNTNEIHWKDIQVLGLAEKFEHVYLSHEIACLKPSREAFGIALTGMGLKAADVLFLDDSLKNIEVAQSLGFSAQQVKSALEAKQVLQHYGVISNTA
ncbi:MAG: HAD-IA family hydrolase [Anaerolineales bacterium]|nr:HAD-IA family hydrolase [Anaerolineales bacterium]